MTQGMIRIARRTPRPTNSRCSANAVAKPRTKEIKTVANVLTTDLQGPFTWESSGIIDASHVLGKDWWLLDVQAHSARAPQPDPTLQPDTAVGEDGQLLAMKVPGSQGGGDDDDDDDGGGDDDDD